MKSLFSHIAAVQLGDIKPPQVPVGKDDTVIGVISPDAQRLWWLYSKQTEKCLGHRGTIRAMIAEYEQLRGTVRSIEDKCDAKLQALQARAEEFRPDFEMSDLLEEMFWNSVRFEFPQLCGKSGIGLRQGFKVVLAKSRGRSMAVFVGPDIIERILFS